MTIVRYGRSAIPAQPQTRAYIGATGVSACFGTFGELLQGALPEPGADFLVTLPVARWAMATFRSDPALPGVVVAPGHKVKARRIAQAILDAAEAPPGGVLTLEGTLPEGKGMASSSADLVAAARAVGNALDLRLAPEWIEDRLREIEPTDGVLYSGIVAFEHRRVRLRRVLGSLRTLTVVGVDEGGTVDTIEFNRRAKPYSPADRREYARLLERLAGAVAAGDPAAAGKVATRSAVLNQALCPKRSLANIIEICDDVGGLGVVAAHSGTMLGILLDPAERGYPRRVSAAVQACSAISPDVSLHRTLSFS